MANQAQKLFVIDAAFLVRASHQAFLGAPLLEVDGVDHTFTYGVCRDLLRLRQTLGAARLVVIFGCETYAESSDGQKVNLTAQFLTELGLPVVNEPKYAVVDICMVLIEDASHFVSANLALLQLTEHESTVIMADVRKGNTIYDASTVRAKFGIAPALIPDFLALTEAPKDSRLTNPQAVRLLERFGGLKELLKAIDTNTLKHRSAIAKLRGNEDELVQHLTELLPSGQKPEIKPIGAADCNLDTPVNREALRLRRFHSLVRLLPTPRPAALAPVEVEEYESTYQPVVDSAALQRLLAALRETNVCAIDTEATDKDPHRAELLGVSFCYKKGEAFYVPVTGEDLRDLSAGGVLTALKEIAQCGVTFVGHNVKFDDLLLRRRGITLSTIGFDTMLAAHECFHDWEFFNLKHLAQVLLGRTIKKYSDVVKKDKNLLDIPFKSLVQYACEDADTTFRLFDVLSKELEIRGLQSQFASRTMPISLQLGRWEFEGIPVDEQRLRALRIDAMKQVDEARDAVHGNLGKGLNVDSNQEINAALLADDTIAESVRGKRVTINILEALSGASEVARALVEYRRKKEVLRRIEDLIEHSQEGRVHPVFNQISSRFGQVTARKPNIFATNVAREAVDKSVWQLYPDAARSLQALVSLSGDEILYADLLKGYPDDFAPFRQKVDEFLLSLVVGTSDSKLARQFLLEQAAVADLGHRIRARYRRVFQWLDVVHTDAVKSGFIENVGRRFFVAGLGSSDLYKRQKAMNLCVRWLLQY